MIDRLFPITLCFYRHYVQQPTIFYFLWRKKNYIGSYLPTTEELMTVRCDVGHHYFSALLSLIPPYQGFSSREIPVSICTYSYHLDE